MTQGKWSSFRSSEVNSKHNWSMYLVSFSVESWYIMRSWMPWHSCHRASLSKLWWYKLKWNTRNCNPVLGNNGYTGLQALKSYSMYWYNKTANGIYYESSLIHDKVYIQLIVELLREFFPHLSSGYTRASSMLKWRALNIKHLKKNWQMHYFGVGECRVCLKGECFSNNW